MGVVGLLACAMGAALSPARAQETSTAPPTGIPGVARLVVETGGEFTSSTGDRDSKFEEFRDIPKGVFFRSFELLLEDENRPYRFFVRGQDLTQRDQRAVAEFDRYGRLKMRFVWDQLPNFSSRGVLSVLNEIGPNFYVVADPTRATLENTLDADLGPVVTNLIFSTPSSDLRSQRKTGLFSLTYTPTNHWEFRANVERQIRSGLRRISIGTYERTQTATGGVFRTLGQEMGERLDHATTIFGAGAAYSQDKWLVNFDYASSFFNNDQLGLIWDNPFRLTDASATGATGGADRGRFAQGQLALPPSNQHYQITISGFVLLPHRTKFSGLFSLAFWRQDEPFLPFTLNTAIVAGNLPAGVTPTDLEALPQPSLGGDSRTINHDYAITQRTTDSLSLTFRYRNYDYTNNTHEVIFPGCAAFGESFWRTAIGVEPIESLPKEFFKQRSSAEAVWKPAKSMKFHGDYVWEGWNRRHRQISRTNEHRVGGRLTLEPAKWFYARTGYHYGDRIPLGTYTPVHEEFVLGRMFDQARRIRHDVDAFVQFTPADRLFFSLNYLYLGDNFDENFFGLHNYLQGQFGADVSYAIREGSNLYAGYSRDRLRTDYAQVAKAGAPDPFRPANTWLRDTRDLVDAFTLGYNSSVFGDRFHYDFSYSLAFSKNNITTTNPFVFEASAANDTQAFPFPEIREKYNELRLATEVRLRENLALGLTYLFQPYRLDDFMWNILDPWIADRVALESAAPRYLFLNARDGNYTGHAASLTLRYTF